MNILITGNMGYIGPVLTKYIKSKANVRIHGIDRTKRNIKMNRINEN